VSDVEKVEMRWSKQLAPREKSKGKNLRLLSLDGEANGRHKSREFAHLISMRSWPGNVDQEHKSVFTEDEV